MKAIHILKKCSVAILSLALLTACEKDGEKIYLSGLEESNFMVSETNVVLSKEISTDIVLSVAWSNNTPVVSNPNMGAPNVFTPYIQISTKEDFSSNVIETQGESESKAYTGAQLNAIAKNLGMEPDVETPVYFRLRGSMGSNIESAYSEVKTVNITSYFIDMTIGTILNTNKEATGSTLSSPNANGIYTGFVGATSWFNFYFEEGDGLVWGNENDGNAGVAFVMTSESHQWNFWYPEPGGCYYTEVNTVSKNWSAIYLPVLSVSGDLTAEMTFDRPNNRWYYVFDAAAAGTINIKLSGQGDRYNQETGDGAPATEKATIAFAQSGDHLALANTPENIAINITATGESTLIVDLSDPKAWTCSVVSGSEEPDVVIEEVFLCGIDDGITSGWNFDSALKLYNEDDQKYSGVVNVNSLWGYDIAIEKDNWADVYKFATGDAYAGTLEFKGEGGSLPAPTPGLYFFDVSLKDLTYTLTAVGNEIYLSGLNDTWDFATSLQATATPGVYAGNITITTVSEWGFKIYLLADWNPVYGGGNGELYFNGDGITDDATLGAGTYTMTVDLINRTYSIQ